MPAAALIGRDVTAPLRLSGRGGLRGGGTLPVTVDVPGEGERRMRVLVTA